MKDKTVFGGGAKVALWLALAGLAGFIVGSWGARDELRAYRKSEKDERIRSSQKAGGFDTFASIVKIPEMTKRPRKTKPAAKPPKSPRLADKAKAAAKARTDDSPAARHTPATARQPPERRSVEDLSVRIEEAQELWRARVEIARAQWKEKLKLSGEAEQAFDGALREMNERLYDSIAAVAELVVEQDSMSPELGLRLVGETTAIMAETYDKVGACVPAEMRTDVSSMQMVDFVDPGVAEPLVGVQGKLESLRHSPRIGR